MKNAELQKLISNNRKNDIAKGLQHYSEIFGGVDDVKEIHNLGNQRKKNKNNK